MSADAFVNISNSDNHKGGNYDAVIRDIAERKVCPFCPEELAKFHKNPILSEGKEWLATDNMYPYKGAKTQILFIHKKHIGSIAEISQEGWTELHALVKKITAERKIPGGTFLMRFGDTRYTGATVTHLHAQIVSSGPGEPGTEPILTRVG